MKDCLDHKVQKDLQNIHSRHSCPLQDSLRRPVRGSWNAFIRSGPIKSCLVRKLTTFQRFPETKKTGRQSWANATFPITSAIQCLGPTQRQARWLHWAWGMPCALQNREVNKNKTRCKKYKWNATRKTVQYRRCLHISMWGVAWKEIAGEKMKDVFPNEQLLFPN